MTKHIHGRKYVSPPKHLKRYEVQIRYKLNQKEGINYPTRDKLTNIKKALKLRLYKGLLGLS